MCARLPAGLPRRKRRSARESAWKLCHSCQGRPDAGRPASTRPLFIARSTRLSRGGVLPSEPLFPAGRRFAGGAGGTRTPDFRLAKAALSPLSYGPTAVLWVVGDGGLEPPTSVLSGPRSNQLS